MTLPEFRNVLFDNIPTELKQKKIWAVWKSVKNPKKSKPDKLPMSLQVDPLTGELDVKPASCNDPDTWMSFEDAKKLYNSSSKYKGLQIALKPAPPKENETVLIAGDVDNVFGIDGTIDQEKLNSVLSMNTYSEYSPTVNGGLRFLCYGRFDPDAGKHDGDYEIYQNSKWITLTGHIIKETPCQINHVQEAVDVFRSKHFKPYHEIFTQNLPKTNVKLTDDQIVKKLLDSINNDIARKVNHWVNIGYIDPENRRTEEDLEYCCLIRGYTQDPDQIDSVFRKSMIMREKWDEKHYSNGDTYGQRTVKTCLGMRSTTDWIYREKIITPIPKTVDWMTFNLNVGYFRVCYSGIYVSKPDIEGNENEVCLSSTPCIITAKGINRDTGDLNYKVLIKGGAGKEETVWRRGAGLLKKEGVLELMNYGLEFQEADYKLMNSYFFEIINTYRSELPSEAVASCSGWKDNYTQFVVGNKIVNCDGVFDIIQIENDTVNSFGQCGNAEEWALGVDDVAKYEPVRFKIYAALGCLLLKKSDIDNYIFDQCCGTTRLKTLTNRLAASMMGHPKKLQLSSQSTPLGVDKMAAACNDLPVFIDESSMNVAGLEELIYRFGNASTRVKSNLSSGLEMSENYNSGLFITGEDSIITENSKGGHHSRVVKETHGVPEDEDGDPLFIDVDTKNKVQKAMRENYGNIIILYIRELLPVINDIEEIVTNNFKRLPDTGKDAIKGRLKGYYAVILTAGEMIERVFSRLGMTPCNAYDIVKNYFNENVMGGSNEPDYIKFLKIAYDMFVSYKTRFGATASSEFIESENLDRQELFGWIDQKGSTTIINFRPQALKDFSIKSVGTKDAVNRYETSLTEWRKQGILNPTESINKETKLPTYRNTRQIRTVHDDKQYAIQVPLEQFIKHLKLSDNTEPVSISAVPDDEGPDDYKHVHNVSEVQNLKYEVPAVTMDTRPNNAPAVTASIHDDIIITDYSTNLHDLLTNSLSGDDIQ